MSFQDDHKKHLCVFIHTLPQYRTIKLWVAIQKVVQTDLVQVLVLFDDLAGIDYMDSYNNQFGVCKHRVNILMR